MLASIIIVGGIVAVWLGYVWGRTDGQAQGYFDGRRDSAEAARRVAALAGAGTSTALPVKPVQAVAQLGKPVFAAAKKAPKKKKKSSY